MSLDAVTKQIASMKLKLFLKKYEEVREMVDPTMELCETEEHFHQLDLIVDQLMNKGKKKKVKLDKDAILSIVKQ